MITPKYKEQVDFLIRILPHIAKEKSLALKDGTAINLFVRDMPRLSVDIDLTSKSIIDDRETALANISAALKRIDESIKTAIPGISITHIPYDQGSDVKLNCQIHNAHVKIEVNTITRGVILPIRMMQLAEVAQTEFGKFAAIQVVSHGKLFGGKICAALDRQTSERFIRYLSSFQERRIFRRNKIRVYNVLDKSLPTNSTNFSFLILQIMRQPLNNSLPA